VIELITPAFISTASLSDETRRSIVRVQARIVESQVELATGRHNDVGLTLGASTGKSVLLRNDQSQLQAIIDSNGIVSTRLKTSQITLQAISDGAQSYLSALTRAHSNLSSPQTIVKEAQSGLQALLESLNGSLDGQYIFSGINSDVRPFEDYFGPASPASRQGIADAFLAEFGITQSDASVAAISAASMSQFLGGEFASEFTDPNWENGWSGASDRNVRNRISRTELIETSINANQTAFRKLASAFTMVGDLGFERLNDQAKQVVIEKALEEVSAAISGITGVQSELGITQERVAASSELIHLQKTLLNKSIAEMEEVDPAEVSTRLSALLTQVEAAYAITRRLHDLSLLNYL
jgi:flagellar hook-associated protein 3 FlgL